MIGIMIITQITAKKRSPNSKRIIMAQTNSKFFSVMVVGENPTAIMENYSVDKKVEPYTGDHVHKDGAVLVTFTSNQPLGILRAFFPYGEDIIPLAPQSFVDEWTDNVRKMAKSLGI